jgi:hypothetical protein
MPFTGLYVRNGHVHSFEAGVTESAGQKFLKFEIVLLEVMYK